MKCIIVLIMCTSTACFRHRHRQGGGMFKQDKTNYHVASVDENIYVKSAVKNNYVTSVDENNYVTSIDENIYVTDDGGDDEDDDELKKPDCEKNEVFKVEYLIKGEKKFTEFKSCKCKGDFERNVRYESISNTHMGKSGKSGNKIWIWENRIYECGSRIEPLKKPYCGLEQVCKTYIYSPVAYPRSQKYLDKYTEHCSCFPGSRIRPNQTCMKTGAEERLKYYTCTSPGCQLQNQLTITLKFQSLNDFWHAVEKIEYCKCDGDIERIDGNPINVTSIDYLEMHFRCISVRLQSDPPKEIKQLVTPTDPSQVYDVENVSSICDNRDGIVKVEYYCKVGEHTFNLLKTIHGCNCTIGRVVSLNQKPERFYNNSEPGAYEKIFLCVSDETIPDVIVPDENIYVTDDDDDDDEDVSKALDDAELKKPDCEKDEVFKVEYLINGEKKFTIFKSCKCKGDFERNVRYESISNNHMGKSGNKIWIWENTIYVCGSRIKPLKQPYCAPEQVCKTYIYNSIAFLHSQKYLDKYTEHCSCFPGSRIRPNQRCLKTGAGERLKYYTCTSPGCQLHNELTITLKFQSLDDFWHAVKMIEYCKCDGDIERIDGRPINVTNIDYLEMHFRCLQSSPKKKKQHCKIEN